MSHCSCSEWLKNSAGTPLKEVHVQPFSVPAVEGTWEKVTAGKASDPVGSAECWRGNFFVEGAQWLHTLECFVASATAVEEALSAGKAAAPVGGGGWGAIEGVDTLECSAAPATAGESAVPVESLVP